MYMLRVIEATEMDTEGGGLSGKGTGTGTGTRTKVAGMTPGPAVGFLLLGLPQPLHTVEVVALLYGLFAERTCVQCT